MINQKEPYSKDTDKYCPYSPSIEIKLPTQQVATIQDFIVKRVWYKM